MQTARPHLTTYQDPVAYLRDMLQFRKVTERNFSVSRATKSLRRISPTLISLILRGDRKLTLDRVDEIAKLIKLNAVEKVAFRNWIASQTHSKSNPSGVGPTQESFTSALQRRNRKDVPASILNDWVNVYVKDFFQIENVRKNPLLLHKQLPSVAPKRIERAIQFLLREGHLRRTLDGSLTLETDLAVADPKATSKKIREFHKSALNLARQAIDLYPSEERFSNTLTLPLNERTFAEFIELIQEFSEKLKDFASDIDPSSDRLYQFVINLSPVGASLSRPPGANLSRPPGESTNSPSRSKLGKLK